MPLFVELFAAGVMLISVAACAPHEDERVEAVDLAAFAPAEARPPPIAYWHGGRRKWSGCAPMDDEDEDVVLPEPPARDGPGLERIATPLPDDEQLIETSAARRRNPTRVIVDYCVDRRGRVVDVKRVRGDEELAEILFESIRRWRFRPLDRNDERERVCERKTFYFRFANRR